MAIGQHTFEETSQQWLLCVRFNLPGNRTHGLPRCLELVHLPPGFALLSLYYVLQILGPHTDMVQLTVAQEQNLALIKLKESVTSKVSI